MSAEFQIRYRTHPTIHFHGETRSSSPYTYYNVGSTQSRRWTTIAKPYQLKLRTHICWSMKDLFLCTLYIPKLVGYAPLHSTLNLAANVVTKYSRIDDSVPLARYSNTKYEVFIFYGDIGYQILMNFLDLCDNDPTFRAALRLPPLDAS